MQTLDFQLHSKYNLSLWLFPLGIRQFPFEIIQERGWPKKLKHNEKSSISKNYGELQQPHILKIRNIPIMGFYIIFYQAN